MMAATERHYGLAQEYFRLKARLLGLPRLKNTDVYAPLGAARVTVAFEEARRQVLEAFDAFDPRFGALARTFFAERRIDAEPRPGKRLGAFCASLGPSANPFVLLGYTDTPRDVSTLAHELGHAIHDRLAARQRPINYQPPLPLAETASTFAELLVLALYQRYQDEGRAFVPGYLELLAAGGSEAPDVLLRRLDVDVDDPAFWDRGFAVIASLLAELRATMAPALS